MMNNLAVFFFCFASLIPQRLVLVTAEEPAAHQAGNNGVYIVYTGAAASSSTGFRSTHLLSFSSMESWKDRVIHRYENAFSGFAARLSEEEAKLIAQRPEVVSVFPDPVLRLHTTRSWDFLREQTGFKPPQNPESNSSLSGGDVIIGIFDSGIWPEARSFNDRGMGPIPKRWKGKCITGPDFKSSNCNRKLIGARNYITSDNSTSARDYDGHGTHVAAIAAGRAVPGASYNGLARGTARGGSPGSRIAVYRACTDTFCDGSAILKAFDDAVADRVDIISVSAGAFDFHGNGIDPISIGAFHAVEKGIMVLGSAGNAGFAEDPPNIVNTAPWMLTVGATTIDRFFESDVVLGNNQLVVKGGGVHSAKSYLPHPLIDGISAKSSDANDYEARNCEQDALDADKVKGKIVLCDYNDREDYLPLGKLEVVTSLGGIGVIYYDYFGQAIDTVSGSSPLVAVDPQDAEKILSYINTTRNPVATILPTVAVAKYKPAPSVAYFSGRGPIYDNDFLIKPDIVAPGVGILSAWPSNETDPAFNILSGSSMACPHVSGVAAMVKSQYPSWTPSAIKSAIMTTANPTNNLKKTMTDNLGFEINPYSYGAGEVDLFGPSQPGLVYETEIKDYLIYYCYNGYKESQIRLLSSSIPANFSCPTPSTQELISNVNYPSIAVVLSRGIQSRTVTRTVTNVGDEESVYGVRVEAPKNLEIQVRPTELKFTKNKKQLSYSVTFKHANQNASFQSGYYGSITWSNKKYSVRIPFIWFEAVVFLCFVSLLLFSFQLVVATGEEPATQAWSYDRYIVYTGAASSSSDGFPSDHILSSYAQERWRDRVIHRYGNSWLSEEEAKLIAQRPEVVSVFPDPVLQLHTTRSWDFLKEQSGVGLKPRQVPKSKSSLSGEDVIIGILDTGIWPEAQSFSDKGLGPIPKRWKGKCMTAPDFKSSNCNRKLIGARNYITYDNSTSARDHDGHGTHIAAIAAGRAVPGASYQGLARGTAQGGSPGSRIAVYRTCNDQGCDGSAVLKAFDDAIADGVDVISLSFGSYGDFDFSEDPVAIGAFHAVENGITVVGSAGNRGSDEFTAIRNVAPWILTVGATTIDRFFESDVALGDGKVIKGGAIHSAKLRKAPVYPLIDGGSATNGNYSVAEASDCLPYSLDGEKVKGKIVLCETIFDEVGVGGRYAEVTSLGGIGVIYIDHYNQLVDSLYDSPMVAVTWQDGAQIQSYINSTRNPVATIKPTVAVAKYKPAPSVAFFSGTGPIPRNYYLLKPHVVAPGVDILSAWPSHETDKAFNVLSGTSMAGPHVAGIAAILKSQHPSWSPSAIKSAIMTTARQTNNLNAPITDNVGNLATPFQCGAGEATFYDPSQPGLVYETGITDYLTYLCNRGHDMSKLKLISSKLPANFSCPSNSSEELMSDMNYPSIAISDLGRVRRRMTVRRTVTNVGEEESVYVATVESGNVVDVLVRVNPRTLHFTKNNKKLSYQVTFTLNNTATQASIGHGSITWSNKKYRVRIPLAIWP